MEPYDRTTHQGVTVEREEPILYFQGGALEKWQDPREVDVGHVLADRTLRQPHKLPHAAAWIESKAVIPVLLGGAEQSGWLCKGLVGKSEGSSAAICMDDGQGQMR